MTWTAGAGPGPGAGPGGWPHALPAVPPAVTRKLGVRGALFAALVAVALVAGAAVMGLTLVALGRPDAVGIGLVLAALPVGPLVGVYLWLDRYEPEPPRLLGIAFLWGALVATAAALVLQTIDALVNSAGENWAAIVAAPLTEEAGKGLFVLLLLWSRRHVIDGVLDGLVYAGLVGIGFAFTENILYFAGAYTGGPDLGPGGVGSATTLFVMRGIFSPFAHPLFTSAIGIGVGIMVGARSGAVRLAAPILGYAVAVALHAAWNASAFLHGGAFFFSTYLVAMVPGFLAFVGLALWMRLREGSMLARSLDDLARLGYVQPQDVPWVARPAPRRTARRNAAVLGGAEGERLMRDYQQQAIELAALHTRVLRGHAPPGYTERGALMAHRLAVLRAHLTALPRPTGGWRAPSQGVAP